MFSRACEYGIKAILYIATQSLQGRRAKMPDIVANAGSPEAFTGKILGNLAKHGIVQSHTGPYGGFQMDRKKMKSTKLSEIVFAIDGDGLFNGCGLGLSECSNAFPCPMHAGFVKVRAELKEMLEATTVFDLATGLRSGQTVLVR